MSRDQRDPNGATAGSAQGDGDDRPMKDTSAPPQKALDAAASEPRDLPTNGGSGDGPKPEEPHRR